MMPEQDPLTPAVLHILLALSDGPRHGYAIMQAVDALSQGRVAMGPGTLYGSIKRMLAADLIVEADPPADETDSRRKYYDLTATGQAALSDELARLADILAYAQRKRLLRDDAS